MKKKKHLLLIIILFISIGFAVLTSNLSINGIASFTDASFDVHFENATIKDKNIDDGSITIGDDTVSITSTGTFEKPGDYIDTSFYVMNSGTMDASLNTLSVSGLSTELKNYFTYTLKYDIDESNVSRGDILRAGQGRKINLHIEYKYDVEQLATVSNLNLTITMNYINPKKTSTSTVWNYEYTGGEQYFIANKSGNYKIEAWGAQGGVRYENHKLISGLGGYSSGKIYLTKNQKVYINVGGQGSIGKDSKGGYNGGGNSPYVNACSGGGATHLALVSGVLSSLSPNNNGIGDIIMVAGAGAGDFIYVGGSGGGYIGGVGQDGFYYPSNEIRYKATGGTQTSGGLGENSRTDLAGSFGQGGTGYTSGGGAGYYGGGSSTADSGSDPSAAGGSGYIGYSELTDKIMYCYNCQSSENEDDETNIKTRSTTNVSDTPTSNYAKIGDGFVRITYLGKN